MTTATAVKPAPRAEVPNDLSAFWLPFTPNRAFKKKPRLVSRAKDMHYFTPEGREILDATAGLWCCNAGHNRRQSWPRFNARRRSSISLRASRSPIRSPSSSRREWPNSRPAISITCSIAIRAPRP